MSGTSLDGVDIAFCRFEKINDRWSFSINNAETIPYPENWRHRLSSVESGSAFELVLTDIEYGHFLGKLTRQFIDKHQVNPDFIASHGHTIFHQPEKKITWQIGKGAAIAAETGVTVICDFRSSDVALGGQGAPLVPIGDKILFPEYDYCLNLGGFANISFDQNGRRIAFDVCPCNIVLNSLAKETGKNYDEDGALAGKGILNKDLLIRLNNIEYYSQPLPKSLGKEWLLNNFIPLLNMSDIPIEDKLMTISEHIAQQIQQAAPSRKGQGMLITGGGSFNRFLVGKIREQTGMNVIIPDTTIINFKEALIFAFLGVLRWRNEVNCLRSYTGASHDNIGGTIYLATQ